MIPGGNVESGHAIWYPPDPLDPVRRLYILTGVVLLTMKGEGQTHAPTQVGICRMVQSGRVADTRIVARADPDKQQISGSRYHRRTFGGPCLGKVSQSKHVEKSLRRCCETT